MKKIILAMGAFSLLSISAMAGDNSSGVYLGLGYGSTKYNDSNYVNEMVTAEKLNDSDSGLKLYGGYQFNNVVGIELGYADLGKFSAGDYSQETTSINLGANVGYSFLDGQLRPYAILGLAMMDLKYSNSPAHISDLSGSHGSLHYGLGIQYEPDFLHGVGIRLAYEADRYGIEVSGFGTSKSYNQVLSQLYGAVQFKF